MAVEECVKEEIEIKTNYAWHMNYLFVQLFELLVSIKQWFIKLNEGKETVNETLLDLLIAAYNVSEQTKGIFDTEKQFGNVCKISELVQYIFDEATAIENEYIIAKKKLDSQGIKCYEKLLNSLYYLNFYIKRYNDNFEEKIEVYREEFHRKESLAGLE